MADSKLWTSPAMVNARAEIARTIKNRRKSLGIKRPDLARAVGVTTNYMGIVEAGKVAPSLPVLLKILDEIGMGMTLEVLEAS